MDKTLDRVLFEEYAKTLSLDLLFEERENSYYDFITCVAFECWKFQQKKIIAISCDNSVLGEKITKLEQQNAEILAAAEIFRDSVLHQRHSMAENGMTNDQVNDVLGLFDDTLGEAIAKAGGDV